MELLPHHPKKEGLSPTSTGSEREKGKTSPNGWFNCLFVCIVIDSTV
jgi:hypothetical protein